MEPLSNQTVIITVVITLTSICMILMLSVNLRLEPITYKPVLINKLCFPTLDMVCPCMPLKELSGKAVISLQKSSNWQKKDTKTKSWNLEKLLKAKKI